MKIHATSEGLSRDIVERGKDHSYRHIMTYALRGHPEESNGHSFVGQSVSDMDLNMHGAYKDSGPSLSADSSIPQFQLRLAVCNTFVRIIVDREVIKRGLFSGSLREDFDVQSP